MEVKTVGEVPYYEAKQKYEEYKNAEKQQGGYFKQKNPLYKDLKLLYGAIKRGHKVFNIEEVIKRGGLNKDNHPAIAIAPMTLQIVYLTYTFYGHVRYRKERWSSSDRNIIIKINNAFPQWSDTNIPVGYTKGTGELIMEAPVPLVPPQYVPKNLDLSDFYVLWEVDHWKRVAPTDPWLCRRLTDKYFILLEGWDLTDLEKMVMNAHL